MSIKCVETVIDHKDEEYMVIVEATISLEERGDGRICNAYEVERYWIYKNKDEDWDTDVTEEMWDVLENKIYDWLDTELEE